jgi:phosphate transport system substrate-binding protein
VKQTPGAIGYVELIYAIQNKISYGSVQNAAGEFVRATTETVSNAAAQAAKAMPKDFRVSIANAPGHDVYPVSSFTWLLFYENPKDKARARITKDFVKWALTEGQRFAPDLGCRQRSSIKRCRRWGGFDRR